MADCRKGRVRLTPHPPNDGCMNSCGITGVYECTVGDAIKALPEHLHCVLQAGSLLELKKSLEKLRDIE
jgi:hypothetical protein